MKAADLPATLGMELKRRKYFTHLTVLEQTLSLVKIRLYISADLFIQVYRNVRYQTTNLALIYNGQQKDLLSPQFSSSLRGYVVYIVKQ